MMNAIKHTGGMDRSRPEILFAALQTMLDSSADTIFVKDVNHVYVACTLSFAKTVGRASVPEIIGHTDCEIFDNELAMRHMEDDRKLFESGVDMINCAEPLTVESDEARCSMTSKYILRDLNGNTVGLLGISTDIINESAEDDQYKRDIEYFLTLSKDMISSTYMDVTAWRVIGQRCRKGQTIIPQYRSMEHLLDVMRANLIDPEGKAKAFYELFSQDYIRDVKEQGVRDINFEYQLKGIDGKTHWITEELELLINPTTGHLELMSMLRDIDSEKREEEKLVRMAETDGMTGLLNRAAAFEEAQEYLQGEGKDGIHTVFMIDIDNFKSVNDRYGHQEGDKLLTEMAKGIQECFRETDIVGRIGGDEFFVLMKNVKNIEAIKSCVKQLLDVVNKKIEPHIADMISLSIGVSKYSLDGMTVEELYKKADDALYKAKKLGKNQAMFASSEITVYESNASAMC